MPVIQSNTSLEYLRVPVTAYVNGVAIDPTNDPVYFAFMPPGSTPVTGDFVAGGWETWADGTHYARALVGPGGGKVLTPGAYRIWIKITDSPEVPIRDIDALTIT